MTRDRTMYRRVHRVTESSCANVIVMRLLAVVMLVAACGDPSTNPVYDAPMADSKQIDAAIDSPTVIGPRGPKSFVLPGASYGLLWDNAASTLCITDDVNRRLDKWTDAGGVQAFG